MRRSDATPAAGSPVSLDLDSSATPTPGIACPEAEELFTLVQSILSRYTGFILRHPKAPPRKDTVFEDWATIIYFTLGLATLPTYALGIVQLCNSIPETLGFSIIVLNCTLKIPTLLIHDWQSTFTESVLAMGPRDALAVRRAIFPLTPKPRLPVVVQTCFDASFFLVPLFVIAATEPRFLYTHVVYVVLFIVGAFATALFLHRALCCTFLIYEVHMQAIARNARALVRELRSEGTSGGVARGDHALFRALRNKYVATHHHVLLASEQYASYVSLVEFTLLLGTVCLAVAAVQLTLEANALGAVGGDGGALGAVGRARLYAFAANAVFMGAYALLIFCTVFSGGANVTAACEELVEAVCDLALSVNANEDPSWAHGFALLRDHALYSNLAFRPHGFRLSRRQGVAFINVVLTILVSAYLRTLIVG